MRPLAPSSKWSMHTKKTTYVAPENERTHVILTWKEFFKGRVDFLKKIVFPRLSVIYVDIFLPGWNIVQYTATWPTTQQDNHTHQLRWLFVSHNPLFRFRSWSLSHGYRASSVKRQEYSHESLQTVIWEKGYIHPIPFDCRQQKTPSQQPEWYSSAIIQEETNCNIFALKASLVNWTVYFINDVTSPWLVLTVKSSMNYFHSFVCSFLAIW